MKSPRQLTGKDLPPGRYSGRAFSLTEALIVLAIVGTLAALVFPLVSRIGEKSREATCVSHLRTLGAASLSYLLDNNGRLFPSKYWYSPSWDSSPGMRDYVITSTNNKANSPEFLRDTVFTCKELKRLHPVKYPLYLNRNYTLNWLAFENHPTTGDPKDERPKRLANIPSLSRMWMFTDGSYTSPTLKESYGVWLRRTDLAGGSAVLAFPHAGRQNTVFFDGHVEPVSRDEFYRPKSIRQFWGEVTARD